MELLFDHEKLDVYRVELGFIAWLEEFLDEASHSSVHHRRELIEQLDRASLSVLLKTAEGNGKRQGRQRAKFFVSLEVRPSSAPLASMRRSPSVSHPATASALVKKC